MSDGADLPTAPPFAELRNHLGERLDFAWMPSAGAARGVVVLGHGVTSHHDRPWLVAVGAACAARGVAALRVSFAGNGRSQGRYRESTIRKEVAELGAVIDALPGWRVAYAGHSMGAAVGVLRAADDPRIEALISLAGMVDVQGFMAAQFGHLVPERDIMLDKPHCPLGRALLDDARAVDTVLPQAARIEQPWLLVHGDADELVPLQDALDAHAAAPRSELRVLEGADHRFRGHEPTLADAVARWLAALWSEPRR